jgi:alkanesulfonate monooxygenase SsuD/methylene tetrahydromethanopterin reductase-like flavin-dependent oxidoreductase (luciferase family)
MVPTVIDADEEAAKAVLRKTLTLYCQLPNYRNYWKEAGYVEEMEAIEAAIAAKQFDKLPSLMGERWLADNTLYGSPAKVRDGIEAWFDAGISTPIVVPSSTSGGQAKAVAELFAAFE